jgi:flagellar biosynthesis component FlhA
MHKNDKLSKGYLRKKCLAENISDTKAQTKLNNELNRNARLILESLNKNSNKLYDISNVNRKLTNESITHKSISKINNDLINFVRHRKSHMQHLSYWKQEWLFTDNPSYNYGNDLCFNE